MLEVDPSNRYSAEQIRNHSWWRLHNGTENTIGVMVGYNRIPIDHEVLNEMSKIGFEIDHA